MCAGGACRDARNAAFADALVLGCASDEAGTNSQDGPAEDGEAAEETENGDGVEAALEEEGGAGRLDFFSGDSFAPLVASFRVKKDPSESCAPELDCACGVDGRREMTDL